MAGMKVEMTGGYSGWQPNVDSPILHAMKESYKQQFGVEPAVKVIHAGLECGIIGAIIPGLDMISVWSDVTFTAFTGRKSTDSYCTEVLRFSGSYFSTDSDEISILFLLYK